MLFTQPTFIEGVYNFWIVDDLQRRGFRPNTNTIQDLINGGGGEYSATTYIFTQCTLNV